MGDAGRRIHGEDTRRLLPLLCEGGPGQDPRSGERGAQAGAEVGTQGGVQVDSLRRALRDTCVIGSSLEARVALECNAGGFFLEKIFFRHPKKKKKKKKKS